MKIQVIDPARGEVHFLTADKFQRCKKRETIRLRGDGTWEFAGQEHVRMKRKQSRRDPGKQTLKITALRPGGNKQSYQQFVDGGRPWALKGVIGG